MTGGDIRAMVPTLVEALTSKISLERFEGVRKIPVLNLQLALKIPISQLVNAIVDFQQQFDKAHGTAESGASPAPQPGGQHAPLVYGEPGVGAPPPPPLDAAPAKQLPPRPHRPHERQPNTWESDVLELQPAHWEYVDRNMWHRERATWHLLDEESLINCKPTPLRRPTPERTTPSDASVEIVPRSRYVSMHTRSAEAAGRGATGAVGGGLADAAALAAGGENDHGALEDATFQHALESAQGSKEAFHSADGPLPASAPPGRQDAGAASADTRTLRTPPHGASASSFDQEQQRGAAGNPEKEQQRGASENFEKEREDGQCHGQ